MGWGLNGCLGGRAGRLHGLREPKLVETEDVRAALNFVARGECQLGIVYATDAAISKDVKVVGVFPENTHAPIIYPLGLIKNNASAVKFYQFLRHPYQ